MVKRIAKIMLFVIFISTSCIGQLRSDSIPAVETYKNPSRVSYINSFKKMEGVITADSGMGLYILEPSIIYKDGMFKMWAHTFNLVGHALSEGQRYFTSVDGEKWTDRGMCGDFIRAHVFQCAENNLYVAVAPFWMDPGFGFNMYLSTEGNAFALFEKNIITSQHNQLGLANPFVWKDDTTWRMMYCDGYNRPGYQYWTTYLASSPDLTHWTKEKRKPMIEAFPDSFSTDGGWMKKIKGVYYWIFHGGYLGEDIYLAKSFDLLHWTTTKTPFITRTLFWEGVENPGGQVADPFVIEQGGYVWIYYEGLYDQFRTQPNRIGLVKIRGSLETIVKTFFVIYG